MGEVRVAGADRPLDHVDAPTADPFPAGAGEHARLSMVRRDGAGAGIGPEDPFVAADGEARPVAVGHRHRMGPPVLDLGADQARHRGVHTVGADHQVGEEVLAATVRTGPDAP